MIKIYKRTSAQVHKNTSQNFKSIYFAFTCALVHLCTCAPARANKKRGFSLLELIIAIAVLAIGLVGILQIFPIGLRASQRAGMMTKVTFLAQNKIEDVKLTGFDEITALPPKIPLSGREGDFEWNIKIDEVELEGIASDSDIRKVTVTITWPERNTTRSKDFVTYVSK